MEKEALYKVDSEYYIFCPTEEAFAQNCIDGGWESIADFELETGVTKEELIGKWFLVVHGRVFIKE